MHGLVTDKSILDNLQKVLSVISTKKYVFNIKIVKTENNFTTINIKGHQFDVPFLLDKNKKYNLIIKDNVIQIEEVKEKINPKVEKAVTGTEKDRVNLEQQTLINILSGILFNLPKYKLENENEKYLYLNGKERTFNFLFEIPVYNNPAKILVSIDKEKQVGLYIYIETDNEKIIKRVQKEIKTGFKTIKFGVVKVSNDKNELVSITKNIDLIV